ncbi:MAG: corrinoid protein [Deltaproteobacteria bacterium]|uniref:Corrinoid protein n=1 Tax=Candidatus Zymogenus saltonus TaxID=2844893 RepID=A0A9D8KD10_9DELT|nr:corrinoid protein [Candidatus Zymogenus saltonus]
MKDKILDQLKDAVIEMNFDDTEVLTKRALDLEIAAVDILNNSLVPALDEVGELFSEGEYFLPDVLLCVKAYENSYRLLEPNLKEGEYSTRGKIMLGTVAGDIHDIGKKILAALLQGNGFDIVDLGVDVSPEKFLEKAEEVNPDIIGMSAMLTTTMPAMKEVIDVFSEGGVRDKYKIIVGGAPLNKKYSDEIGADGYGEDAQSGVELVKSLLK